MDKKLQSNEWLDLLKEADLEDWLSVFVALPLLFIILMGMVVVFGD
jgi:hypothetical protein